MTTVFLFMLQLRMADEIKDFGKDSKAFPERILSQGIIPLSLIRYILYSTITIELIMSALMGKSHLIYMIILQVWAFLMAKEFFRKEFLEEQVTLSLVLHQMILPPLAIYSALAFISIDDLVPNLSLVLGLIYLSLIYTIYELARKTWSPDRENENADSYTRFWGINGAIFVQMTLTLIVVLLMRFIPIPFSKTYIWSAYGLAFIYLNTLTLFKKKTTRKMSKMVEAGGSIFLLGMCALNAFLL
jgi:4-hydroxybenzoate polyprenyltransferase